MKKLLKTKTLAVLVLMFIFAANFAYAQMRLNVTDWYIKDFGSKIVVNKDSSLDITETILADCGSAIGKHGIFRILPTSVNIEGKTVAMPVKLLSITDANGKAWQYSASDSGNALIWKIGDPNVTVQGENTFVIHYLVKNTIRFQNPKFDEFYWNLNGNFWDLETDKFHAQIIFPQEVTAQNSQVDYYTGEIGSKSKSLAKYVWAAPNVLEFTSTGMLAKKEGITASVTFPKNIFTPYKPTFWELYGQYFFFMIPILAFAFCFVLWKKFGEDPKVEKAVIAEYDVPGNLSPIELGMLMKNGSFRNEFITAEIVFLATKGIISLKEVEDKILFFKNKDYELTRTGNSEAEAALNEAEKNILDGIFESGSVIQLSYLENKFYQKIDKIKTAGKNQLKNKNLIVTAGAKYGIGMFVLGGLAFWITFPSISISPVLSLSLLISAICLIVFGFLMPKRTPEGAELNWQIQGLKLFMETVDKDRAAFYEKENIFEKCLPYAIVFGITNQWIKRMQEIYGEDFYAHYAPAWYVGSMGSFNADSFASSMNSLASAVSANAAAPSSSSSGSGGGGFSGGGGGGGGGGGW